MSLPPKRWLQRELQHKLLGPVLAMVFFGGLLAAYGADYLVAKTFDRWLLDSTRALAEQVSFEGGAARVQLSPQAEAILTYDLFDKVEFLITEDDRPLLGNTLVARDGSEERTYLKGAKAYTAEMNGRPVRVGWVPVAGPQGQRIEVRVAETLVKRQRAHRDLLLLFSPLALLAIAVAWLVASVLQRTLQPLERIAAGWALRSHASLAPVSSEELPRELTPFGEALNELLGRVRGVLERERQFAATAAHQLRTPLTGLQLGLERAAAAPELSESRAILAGLGGATQRMARLVQQLLALSRLDPEVRAGLDFREVELGELARNVGETYLDTAAAHGVELELQEGAAPVHVAGHAELLSEALGNLIDNAIRYTPKGGRVLIEVLSDPPALVVSDTGPGIPPALRERVFERFERGTATGGDGSGLGLAIVREIASLHGASVSADAAAGGGARLTIRFNAWSAPERD